MSPLMTRTGSAGRSSSVRPPAVPSGVVSRRYVDPRAELPAVAAERLDQLVEVAGDDGDVAEAEPRELAEDQLDDRHRLLVAQRHQRLGEDVRVGPQPRPFAAGQECCLHRWILLNLSSIAESECGFRSQATGFRISDHFDPTSESARRDPVRQRAHPPTASIVLHVAELAPCPNGRTRPFCLRGLLEDGEQPLDVDVEGLLTAQPTGLRGHRLAAPCRRPSLSSASISSASASGRAEDEALLAVGHQLAGAVLLGRDHWQAASQGSRTTSEHGS